MYLKLAEFPERANTFFNSMLEDLNPRIYKISTDRFVYQEVAVKLTGQVDLPNATVNIYINGGFHTSVLAFGDGTFEADIRLFPNENEISVTYS